MATEWISRNAVFAALDMCAVMEHYQIQAGRGSSFRINCPFHEDERPSCSVDTNNKVFNCFGCEAQGNVLDFIAAMEGLDTRAEFRAVLETAIDIIGHNPSPPRNARRNKSNEAHSSSRNPSAENTQSDTDKVINGVDGEATNNVTDEFGDTRVSQNTDDNQSLVSDGKSPGKPTPRKRCASKSRTKNSKAKPGNEIHSNRVRDNFPPNKILQAPAFPLKLERQHAFLDERGIAQELLEEFGVGFETRSNALMAGRICLPVHNAKGELVAYAGRWAGVKPC